MPQTKKEEKPAAKSKDEKPVKETKKEEKVMKVDKAGKKEVKIEKKKEVKKAKKVVVKNKVKLSNEARQLQKKLKGKIKRLFRGRFGKKNSVRSIKKEKWQKWRKPRGIDAKPKTKGDTIMPHIGFRINKKLRFLHPSGYQEILVRNSKDLDVLKDRLKNENLAVRIAGKTGLKKRNEIVEKANQMKAKVLN